MLCLREAVQVYGRIVILPRICGCRVLLDGLEGKAVDYAAPQTPVEGAVGFVAAENVDVGGVPFGDGGRGPRIGSSLETCPDGQTGSAEFGPCRTSGDGHTQSTL